MPSARSLEVGYSVDRQPLNTSIRERETSRVREIANEQLRRRRQFFNTKCLGVENLGIRELSHMKDINVKSSWSKETSTSKATTEEGGNVQTQELSRERSLASKAHVERKDSHDREHSNSSTLEFDDYRGRERTVES